VLVVKCRSVDGHNHKLSIIRIFQSLFRVSSHFSLFWMKQWHTSVRSWTNSKRIASLENGFTVVVILWNIPKVSKEEAFTRKLLTIDIIALEALKAVVSSGHTDFSLRVLIHNREISTIVVFFI
jgi:hypothetical protein